MMDFEAVLAPRCLDCGAVSDAHLAGWHATPCPAQGSLSYLRAHLTMEQAYRAGLPLEVVSRLASETVFGLWWLTQLEIARLERLAAS